MSFIAIQCNWATSVEGSRDAAVRKKEKEIKKGDNMIQQRKGLLWRHNEQCGVNKVRQRLA